MLAFVPTGQVFAETLIAFPHADFSDFALLQSTLHEAWVRAYASSLETRVRYNPSDAFETFACPQPTLDLMRVGERFHLRRASVMAKRNEGLTKTYNHFHDPDESAQDLQKLRELHVEMDKAVAAVYGWDDLNLAHDFHETKQGVRFTMSEAARREVLGRLLKLNHERYAEEVKQGLHDKKGKGKRATSGRSGNNSDEPEGASLYAEEGAEREPEDTSA
jgi:hypothetical protein